MRMKILAAVATFAALTLSSASYAGDAFLADRHAARGADCTACHTQTPPAKTAPAVAAEKCLACHGDYAKLKDRTKDVQPNPHYTHLLDQPCTECHKPHGESVNMCDGCHRFGLKVP